MKKELILCGFVAAAASALWASGDQIALFNGGVLTGAIDIDKVESINYFKDTNSDGYTHFMVNYLDGTKSTHAIDDYHTMTYEDASAINPLTVTVTPHHYSASLDIQSSDPDAWYRFIGLPESQLQGLDPQDWAMTLFEMDAAYIHSVAEADGYPLSAYKKSDIFDKGSDQRDWFPSVYIDDNTPIALCYYTADIINDEVTLTSTPRILRFTTKELVDMGVEFDITADMTSTKITVNAVPKNLDKVQGDFYYYIELHSLDEVLAIDTATLLSQTLSSLENLVYRYGMTWDEVLYKGQASRTYTNRRAGDEWVAFVYGVEYGVMTTKLYMERFVIPEAEVVDDCQFDVALEQLTPGEVSLKVNPSNPDTRWAAFLVEKSKLENSSAEYYIANKVYHVNYMNTFQWETTDYMHQGEYTITTVKDYTIDGKPLTAGVEYQVLIAGFENDGTRTTAVKAVDVVTETDPELTVSFKVEFGKLIGSNSYRTMKMKVIPSDPDARYYWDYLPASNYYSNLSWSDEEFIQRNIEVAGTYLQLYSGTLQRTLSFNTSWNSSIGDYAWEPYIIALFGYDGGATSPLYLFKLDAETGVITQVRGPEDVLEP